MNTHVRRAFYIFVAGFVSLVAVLAYWQVYARESLANNPDNGFQTRRAIEAPRGLILARDGETVLARSKKQIVAGDDIYKRVYPEGPVYAGVVGYWSTRYGATGIEIGENSNLSSTAEPATVDEFLNQISGGPQAGNNVTLTLDPKLQELAYEQLAQSSTGRGSLMAVDPQTGEIRALASHPSYDPNNIDERFPQILKDPNQPLLDRATQGLYVPGSVMKVLTAAAALEKGLSPASEFNDTGSYQAEAGGYRITNYGGYEYGRVTFAKALAKSINTVFSQVAIEHVGARAFVDMAERFGFEDSYSDFPLQVAPSSLGSPPSEWDKNDLAAAAFGQAEVQTNVFQMALMTAAIANDGVMMQPRIVREVRSSDGIILERTTPDERTGVLEEPVVEDLTGMMEMVVSEQGTAPGGQIPDVRVAGKTGTAEVSSGEPNSWFVAFAPAEDPEIAIAVLIENGGDGEEAALPVARTVMESYLESGGKR